MRRFYIPAFLLLSSLLSIAQGIGGTAGFGGSAGFGGGYTVAAGISVTNAGSNSAASGHTLTIANVTLSTGDSLASASSTPGLNGNVTAAWGAVTCTEQFGGGVGTGGVENHTFTCDNVTGGTANLVFTKTDSGDDSKVFVGAAIRITGLTSHVLDQSNRNGFTADTDWSTAATPTLTSATEAAVAFLTATGNTGITFGTWQNGWTGLANVGQASGTCCVISYGYFLTSSTAAVTGTTSGNTAEDVVGAALTFK